jgi:hypothetical protein
MVAYIGLWLGRGFSGRELHTPIRALGPDENPPGDQVTPRAEITGLSHRPRQSAQMLLPRMASPVLRHLQDTTRHAPTQLHSSNTACTRQVGLAAFYRHFPGFKFFLLTSRIQSRPPEGTQAVIPLKTKKGDNN